MDNERIKSIIIGLIDNDENVRNKIRAIAKSAIKDEFNQSEDKLKEECGNPDDDVNRLKERIKILENDLNNLQSELDETKKQKATQEEEYKRIIKDNKKAEEDLTEKLDRCEKSNKDLKEDKARLYKENSIVKEENKRISSRYSEVEDIHSLYLNLGDAVIANLERILNKTPEVCSSPLIFIANGVQENNILALWDRIATNYDEYHQSGKADDLIKIFIWFLGLYKEVSFKNVCIMEVKEGDKYDEWKHTRTNDSNAVGYIEHVILPGFAIGKNTFRKALVYVK